MSIKFVSGQIGVASLFVGLVAGNSGVARLRWRT